MFIILVFFIIFFVNNGDIFMKVLMSCLFIFLDRKFSGLIKLFVVLICRGLILCWVGGVTYLVLVYIVWWWFMVNEMCFKLFKIMFVFVFNKIMLLCCFIILIINVFNDLFLILLWLWIVIWIMCFKLICLIFLINLFFKCLWRSI